MDTTEELKGTYFYKGLNNLSAIELLFGLWSTKQKNKLAFRMLLA